MLIVLRGNSGSGKSTVARMLQQELGWPTAVLEQDYFCRVVFDEPDQKRRAHADLLEVSAAHCLQQGHHVVLDGIFNSYLYADSLERIATHTDDARFFGFDLDFEETARRHATRDKATTFGVEEMRSWFHGWQPLPFVTEQRIGPDLSPSAIVRLILESTR